MPAGFRRHLVGKTLLNVFHYSISSAEIRFVGKIVIIHFHKPTDRTLLNSPLNSAHHAMLYPQNDDRIVAVTLWRHVTLCTATSSLMQWSHERMSAIVFFHNMSSASGGFAHNGAPPLDPTGEHKSPIDPLVPRLTFRLLVPRGRFTKYLTIYRKIMLSLS